MHSLGHMVCVHMNTQLCVCDRPVHMSLLGHSLLLARSTVGAGSVCACRMCGTACGTPTPPPPPTYTTLKPWGTAHPSTRPCTKSDELLLLPQLVVVHLLYKLPPVNENELRQQSGVSG